MLLGQKGLKFRESFLERFDLRPIRFVLDLLLLDRLDCKHSDAREVDRDPLHAQCGGVASSDPGFLRIRSKRILYSNSYNQAKTES